MSKIDTQSGNYVIKNTDSIERISDSGKIVFNKLWIYPSKGVSQDAATGTKVGKLIPNGALVSVGEVCTGGNMTPDDLDTTDINNPIKYELPVGEQKLLRDVLIQGTAGDGIVFKYWP